MSTTSATAASVRAPGHPLSVPYFRNFWIGSTISLFGDQFFLVALPWLVLQLASSSLALGAVLGTAAIPRAVLMLLGGAVTDRFSPRRVLIIAALTRMVLVGLTAILVWLRIVEIWHLYVLTFLFGVADAFSLPSGLTLLPGIVAPAQLQTANSLVESSTVLTQMAGPAPAGWMIRTWGVTSVLFLDALSFLAVIAALFKAPSLSDVVCAAGPREHTQPSLLLSIGEGLRTVNRDLALRSLLIVSAAVNFCIAGPVIVGLASLAKFRFNSPAAFGTFLSFFSGGAFAGMLLAGVVAKKSDPMQDIGDPVEWSKRRIPQVNRRRGMQFIVVGLLCGLEMIVIGLLPEFASVIVLLAAMGFGAGFVNVQFGTLLQTRVDSALLGRVMSILMLSTVGLTPASYAAAGALARWSVTGMFVVAGAVLACICVIAITGRAAREIE